MEGPIDPCQGLLSEFTQPLRAPFVFCDGLQGVSRFESESLRILLVGRHALEFTDLLLSSFTPHLVPVASLQGRRLWRFELQNNVQRRFPDVAVLDTEFLH